MTEQEIQQLIRSNPGKYYVYELWRPDKNECFYVGKGINGRIFEHTKCINTKFYKDAIIKRLMDNGFIIDYRIAGFFKNELIAFDFETELILKYGRHDLGTGTLANLTNGGEGLSGYTYTEDQRKNKSEAAKKTWMDPKSKQNRLVSLKKAVNKPETKKKLSNAMKIIMSNPEIQEKRVVSIKKSLNKPEVKQKQSDITRIIMSKRCGQTKPIRENCTTLIKTYNLDIKKPHAVSGLDKWLAFEQQLQLIIFRINKTKRLKA